MCSISIQIMKHLWRRKRQNYSHKPTPNVLVELWHLRLWGFLLTERLSSIPLYVQLIFFQLFSQRQLSFCASHQFTVDSISRLNACAVICFALVCSMSTNLEVKRRVRAEFNDASKLHPEILARNCGMSCHAAAGVQTATVWLASAVISSQLYNHTQPREHDWQDVVELKQNFGILTTDVLV